MTRIRFTAYGIPVTQGSARAFVHGGRAFVTHASGGKLLSWRSVVSSEAAKAMEGLVCFEGPISLYVLFVLPRPKSAKKRIWPDRKPDLSKLTRALEDALKGIVFQDDARVCTLTVSKCYGDPARAEVEVTPL